MKRYASQGKASFSMHIVPMFRVRPFGLNSLVFKLAAMVCDIFKRDCTSLPVSRVLEPESQAYETGRDESPYFRTECQE